MSLPRCSIKSDATFDIFTANGIHLEVRVAIEFGDSVRISLMYYKFYGPTNEAPSRITDQNSHLFIFIPPRVKFTVDELQDLRDTIPATLTNAFSKIQVTLGHMVFTNKASVFCMLKFKSSLVDEFTSVVAKDVELPLQAFMNFKQTLSKIIVAANLKQDFLHASMSRLFSYLSLHGTVGL